MAMGDIYVLKMKQQLYLQDLLNVFYYRTSFVAGGDDAEDLKTAFDSNILLHWKDCVHNSISVTSLEVFQISNPSNFFEGTPVHGTGTRTHLTTNRAPSWAAFSYKSNRNGAGTRSSYKRFAGLLDEDINANSLDPSFTGLAAVGLLQTALGDFLLSGLGNTYHPIQVKSGWITGLPPIENFPIDSWIAPTLTSQVSRKA